MRIYKTIKFDDNAKRFVGKYDEIEITDRSHICTSIVKVHCLYIKKNCVEIDKDIYIDLNTFKDKSSLYYLVNRGFYAFLAGDDTRFCIFRNNRHSSTFVYSSVERTYEAFSHLDEFESVLKLPSAQLVCNYPDIPYTIGVEYETSNGIVPENECFKYGLIPLRDGSIAANEYATTVLKGNIGLVQIKRQIGILNKYTKSDKNCSIHIHFGGFPLHPMYLYTVYKVCCKLEQSLENILPAYTFHTDIYKGTGKNYCAKLPDLNGFSAFYNYFECVSVRSRIGMTRAKNLPNLFQPHPCDPDGCHKWQIPTRYHWVNFVNALNYNRGKTIEFRFLKPTRNYHLIINWIGIFSSILSYCEDLFKTVLHNLKLDKNFNDNESWLKYESEVHDLLPKSRINLANIAKYHYDSLHMFINTIQQSTLLQDTLNDKIGEYTIIPDKMINQNFMGI